MTFRAFDIGTFLVRSRSRHGEEHILSLIGDPEEGGGCSCEGYRFSAPFNTCAHYREAIRRRQSGKLSVIVAMKGKA
jgi:hypothetical protein